MLLLLEEAVQPSAANIISASGQIVAACWLKSAIADFNMFCLVLPIIDLLFASDAQFDYELGVNASTRCKKPGLISRSASKNMTLILFIR